MCLVVCRFDWTLLLHWLTWNKEQINQIKDWAAQDSSISTENFLARSLLFCVSDDCSMLQCWGVESSSFLKCIWTKTFPKVLSSTNTWKRVNLLSHGFVHMLFGLFVWEHEASSSKLLMSESRQGSAAIINLWLYSLWLFLPLKHSKEQTLQRASFRAEVHAGAPRHGLMSEFSSGCAGTISCCTTHPLAAFVSFSVPLCAVPVYTILWLHGNTDDETIWLQKAFFQVLQLSCRLSFFHLHFRVLTAPQVGLA